MNFKLGTAYNDPHHRHARTALGGCSNHHLQGRGHYCGGRTTGSPAAQLDIIDFCAIVTYLLVLRINYNLDTGS